MRFLSVCSGIEAASVAWNPLGWHAAAFSEIEPFPCSVLAHHYPDVPNRGDMTNFEEWPLEPVDLLCGGTPCQSFSVAGLRKGLADPRGNLMLTYGAIAARYRPKWLVWENVPGVLSSNEGRDFGAFLGMLGQLGYGFAYRVLDAQYFGVPQRRRRVFVVGCAGNWRSAAAVLFERHSLSGHPAPSRSTGQGFAAATAPSLTASGRGVGRTGESRGQDPVVATLDASFGRLQGCSGQDMNHGHSHLITHALTGEGFDASEDGTGRGTPLVPVAFAHQAGGTQTTLGYDPASRTAPTLAANQTPAIAFSAKDHGADAMADCSPTMRAGGHSGSHANAGVMPAIQLGMQVRRLTPRECERLQGFPDDYTLVPHRGKEAADGPRYKALGNSWAVPNVRWIGARINQVEALHRERQEAA